MSAISKLTKAALALGCAAAALAACTTNPYTGESQFIVVSDAELSQMSTQAWEQMLAQEPVSNDPALNDRARRVADRVVQGAGLADRPWQVRVFDSDERNAFVLPGGQIGVYRGMMQLASTDDQLAAVLGHEVGHVVGRHAAERASQQMGAGLGAQVLGGVLGNQGFGSPQQISQVFGLGAQYGVVLPYSRNNELEADLLGIDYMVRAGYNPRQAITLWQNMAAEGGARGPAFMSTHPNPASRIVEIERYIAERGY
jgi:predicted Zn-dependent protease